MPAWCAHSPGSILPHKLNVGVHVHSRGRGWRIRNSRLLYAARQVRSQPGSMRLRKTKAIQCRGLQGWLQKAENQSSGRQVGGTPGSTQPSSGQHSSESASAPLCQVWAGSSGWPVTVKLQGLIAGPPGEKAQAWLTDRSHKRVRRFLLWQLLAGRGSLS